VASIANPDPRRNLARAMLWDRMCRREAEIAGIHTSKESRVGRRSEQQLGLLLRFANIPNALQATKSHLA